MVPFANKIVVINHKAVCTARTQPRTPAMYVFVYTDTQPCTPAMYVFVYTDTQPRTPARGVYGTYTAVHMCVCIHGPKMAVYTALHGWYKAV